MTTRVENTSYHILISDEHLLFACVMSELMALNSLAQDSYGTDELTESTERLLGPPQILQRFTPSYVVYVLSLPLAISCCTYHSVQSIWFQVPRPQSLSPSPWMKL